CCRGGGRGGGGRERGVARFGACCRGCRGGGCGRTGDPDGVVGVARRDRWAVERVGQRAGGRAAQCVPRSPLRLPVVRVVDEVRPGAARSLSLASCPFCWS
ncbi:hypothetical protein AMAG_19685, partial [Allomyces macrogynus ATCC 38327]